MDSAFQLFNIRNLVIVSSTRSKEQYLKLVYPHNINCVVLTKEEAMRHEGDFKIVFIGCFMEKFADNENIILDDVLRLSYLSDKKHRIEWTPEMLASFIGAWFGQTKIRKMHNNFNDYFSHRGESWIKELMV